MLKCVNRFLSPSKLGSVNFKAMLSKKHIKIFFLTFSDWSLHLETDSKAELGIL